MNRSILGWVLATCALLPLSGCTLDTGEGADSEDVGEVEQAIVEGSWVYPVLQPDTRVATSSGYYVCRDRERGGNPGRVSGVNCLYTSGGRAYSTPTFHYLANPGNLAWETQQLSSGRGGGFYPNPRVPSQMVTSYGVGVCAASVTTRTGSYWMPGKLSGSSCKYNNGSSETTVADFPIGTVMVLVRR